MGKMADFARNGEGRERLAADARYPMGSKPKKADEARSTSSPMAPKPVEAGPQAMESGGGMAQEPVKAQPQPSQPTGSQFKDNPRSPVTGGSGANPMREQTTPMYTPSTGMRPEPKPKSKVTYKPKSQVPSTNRTDAQFKS